MKKLVVLFTLLFLTSLVSAALTINEVEMNPVGADSGNEWVEFFNTDSGNPVDVSGWYITNSSGFKIYLPNISISDFYVLDNLSNLTNVPDQNVTLYNEIDAIIDTTGNFSDIDDDSNTYSRLPDGTGAFVFQEQTKNISNVPNLILNKSVSDSCVLPNELVKISANVTGYCIESVVFRIFNTTDFLDLSGTIESNTNYSATVPISFFPISNNITWTVIASDCFNRTTQNGNETFYINSNTSLSVSPASPNHGIWYTTEPFFSLFNPDAAQLFYRWDALGIKNYSSPFGLEDAPNNALVTGGPQQLNYNSNVCNESEQSLLFYFDFFSPEIKSLTPPNFSLTNDMRPTISAYLEEKYGDNSGINFSSISMAINGILVAPIITPQDTVDALVQFTPLSDLPLGKNIVEVNVSDNSNRFSSLAWEFEVEANFSTLTITLNDPINSSYQTRRIPFNLSLNQNVSQFGYTDNSDNTPRFRRLCRNCDSYGLDKTRAITFRDGDHNISIIAMDELGNTKELNVFFNIDSVNPRITKTSPNKNSVVNGSLFEVKYSETNPANITLFYNNTNKLLENCPSGRNVICSTSLNLEDYNSKELEFFFTISDGINNVFSKSTQVFVDTTSPVLTINSPEDNSNVSKSVPFNISISESVKLEYIDLSDNSPRFKNLCSNCDSYGLDKAKTKTFKNGAHQLIIRATDKAGNSDEESINILVT